MIWYLFGPGHRRQLDRIEAKLDGLIARGETQMTDIKDVKAIVAEIDSATNAVAAKLDAQAKRIEELIAAGGATPEQLAELATSLTTERDRLQTLGADPANPVPAVV